MVTGSNSRIRYILRITLMNPEARLKYQKLLRTFHILVPGTQTPEITENPQNWRLYCYTCLTSLDGVFSDLEALLVLGFRRFSSRSGNKPREVVLSPALSIIGKDVLLKFCIFFTFIFSSAATKFLED